NATMLNKDETTADNICTDAITPLNTAIRAMLSAIVNGEEPNKYIFNYVQCMDSGAVHGGLGRVLFKVYVEKVE
ncbi:MAG: hypothetical protein JSV16_09635, partial [Candidatus Hydrogenedentota bacterium]